MKKSLSLLQVHNYCKRFATTMTKSTYSLDRSSPENIEVRLCYSASHEAMVEWSFPGDISELAHYIVKAETDGQQAVKTIVHDVLEKKAILKPLHLSSKYTVTVTAVYRDGIERECSVEFFKECGGFIQQLQCST